MRKRLLIIGVDSLVGSNLYKNLDKKKYLVWGTTRRPFNPRPGMNVMALDLSRLDNFSCDFKFDIVVICAGITSVLECEDNPLFTKIINNKNLFKFLDNFISQAARVVYLSSDAVFDGSIPKPSVLSTPSPISEYGKQKLNAELTLLGSYTNLRIIRFGKIISERDELFKSWRIKICNGENIEPYLDYITSPISIEYAENLLIDVIENFDDFGQIIHATGSRDFSYVDIATFIIKNLDASMDLLAPKEIQDYRLKRLMRDYVSLENTIKKYYGPHDLDCFNVFLK